MFMYNSAATTAILLFLSTLLRSSTPTVHHNRNIIGDKILAGNIGGKFYFEGTACVGRGSF